MLAMVRSNFRDTFKVGSFNVGAGKTVFVWGAAEYLRITEKRRLATAAAAIKERIVNRRSPLVFLPVLPLKKGSDIVSDMVDDD
jgi:hypothetical protein